MPQIRILPEILSNQIAAGEVVQRPSSVVKELVENSIDANATRITIEIERGGKSLIRISDDGGGLSRDEALLSIERYATSKISNQEDLFSIATFGFRGEALPSIASISRFTLVSRTADSDIGTRIEIAGGKLVKVSDEGAPCGTLIEVKHLFYNTPARQKFLKGGDTEGGHIADAVAGLALGNPQVGFRLFINKKLVKNFPTGQDLFQRSMQVLGKDVRDKLYPLKGERDTLFVSGVCSNPLVTRSTSNRIYLFVNNRLVYDRGLVAAVFRGYQGRIMKGRFPMGVVCVRLPFDQVDVNVHPSKREIKFLLPGPVYQAVGRAVETALAHAQKDLVSYTSANTNVNIATTGKDFCLPDRFEGQQPDQVAQPALAWGAPPGSVGGVISHEIDRSSVSGPDMEPRVTEGVTTEGLVRNTRFHKGFDPSFHVLGQVMGTYIVAQKENNLVLVDQHAAHERVVYDALKKRHQGLKIQSQDLLVAEVLELTHGEADCLESILEELLSFGLRIEPFGGTTFVVKAIPILLEGRDLKALVLGIIETFMEERVLNESWQDACLISMACHGAIRANKPMNHPEMVRLLEDLEKCENSLHCPHGRPTLVSFDSVRMEKLFKRLV